MSETKQIINNFFENPNNEKHIKLKKYVDRIELYQFEAERGKSIFEMGSDELEDLIRTFKTRPGKSGAMITPNMVKSTVNILKILFDYYSENYRPIDNLFYLKKFKSPQLYKSVGEDMKITKQIIDNMIAGCYKALDPERALFCETIILLYLHGLQRIGDLLEIKEWRIDFPSNLIELPCYTIETPDYVLQKLKEEHSLDSYYSGNGALIKFGTFENGYFKYPTKPKTDKIDSYAATAMNISVSFNTAVKGIKERITLGEIYYFGFYYNLLQKYGLEQTERMVNAGKGTIERGLFLKEATHYDLKGFKTNSSYLKNKLNSYIEAEKSVRQSVST